MIKRGCAIALVLLLGTFWGYYTLLRGKVESPGDALLAGFGAIGLLLFLSSLKRVVFGEGDVAAFERAERGLPLEDGKREAVWGPIAPLGGLLVAPCSGRSCVAYEYDAKNPATAGSDGESSPGGSSLSGLALAPSMIRSDRGDVRLLGFNLLAKFPPRSFTRDEEAMARMRDFAARSEFTQSGLASIGSLLSQMDEVMADDDGSVRKDWRFCKPEEVDLASCTLEEKAITPGTTVTAVGIWDASRGGLVPKHGNSMSAVTLAPGGGAAMVEAAKKRPWGLLVFSVLWAGFAHVFIVAVLMMSR